ncbi:MAG: hypothetical protein KO254_04425 [Methanoculleus marisnigri]|nr:hypothetical protein [Methanoculleus marisnigri]
MQKQFKSNSIILHMGSRFKKFRKAEWVMFGLSLVIIVTSIYFAYLAMNFLNAVRQIPDLGISESLGFYSLFYALVGIAFALGALGFNFVSDLFTSADHDDLVERLEILSGKADDIQIKIDDLSKLVRESQKEFSVLCRNVGPPSSGSAGGAGDHRRGQPHEGDLPAISLPGSPPPTTTISSGDSDPASASGRPENIQ